MTEEIVNPTRYTQHAIECWDLGILAKMHFLPFSVMKYVWRYEDKNGLDDLNKALVFLEKMLREREEIFSDIMHSEPMSLAVFNALHSLAQTMNKKQADIVRSLVMLSLQKPDIDYFVATVDACTKEVTDLIAEISSDSLKKTRE